jgi:dienelactone hydrolase
MNLIQPRGDYATGFGQSRWIKMMHIGKVVACGLMLWAGATAAAASETVTFRGDGLTLRGILYRPAGAGPFPAVVALHGCSGLYGKDGDLSPRHSDWAERLVDQGFVVLLPDSFGPRGVEGSQCRTRDRVTRPSRERVADAFAAKTNLQSRPDVKPEAVSLLGWSNGGSTVLYAVDRQDGPRDGTADFARAVAFYPGCRIPSERGKWQARIPLLILMGAADDWTPARPCEDLADQRGGAPVSLKLYAGAYHDFDHPDLPVHTVRGLAYTGKGGGSAHTGTNPAARADAIKRVPAFLAQ